MRYEILDDGGAVINTIVAPATFVGEHYPGRYRAADAATSASADPAPRHISVGAFFDRFGAVKYSILADQNPLVQALIADCSVRQHIDLDRGDLPVALGMLVNAGHAIDAEDILGAPIQPGELP